MLLLSSSVQRVTLARPGCTRQTFNDVRRLIDL